MQVSRGIPAYQRYMRRTNTPELLDSDTGSPRDIQASLQDLCRINRWFGGVATTYSMVQRVVAATGAQHLSLLVVRAGFGGGPQVPRNGARRGAWRDEVWFSIFLCLIALDPTCLPGREVSSPRRLPSLFGMMPLTW